MASTSIRIATSPDLLLEIFRFRYKIYVSEMGRDSPYADHDRKIMRHPLDSTAVNLVAFNDNSITGVVRSNVGVDGSFGPFFDFYDIQSVGADHPNATSITSGLMVTRDRRGGHVGARLSS